jgi:dihydrolipoamide dehydrogenase
MGIIIRQARGHGKILGGGIVGTHAGDMIGEIALAIEMGAEVAHGSCTDLPPGKK